MRINVLVMPMNRAAGTPLPQTSPTPNAILFHPQDVQVAPSCQAAPFRRRDRLSSIRPLHAGWWATDDPNEAGHGATASRLRALGYGAAAGAGFGLFFLCLKNAGQSGVLWPVAVSRTAGTLVAFGLALATRTRAWRRDGTATIALVSGAVDAAANVCYVLATRAGLFGLAVVITSLYPGMTVLLARWLLGERMRWLQRAGLLLAVTGVVLLAA